MRSIAQVLMTVSHVPYIIFTRPNSGHVYSCIQTTSD